MSRIIEITSALTGEKMQVFDFSKDPADPADNGPMPVVLSDTYTGPSAKPVSLDFSSLLNGTKTTRTE